MCCREAASPVGLPQLISFTLLVSEEEIEIVCYSPRNFTLLFFHFTLLLLDCFPKINNLFLPPIASHLLSGKRSKLYLQQPAVLLPSFLLSLFVPDSRVELVNMKLQEGKAATLRAV